MKERGREMELSLGGRRGGVGGRRSTSRRGRREHIEEDISCTETRHAGESVVCFSLHPKLEAGVQSSWQGPTNNRLSRQYKEVRAARAGDYLGAGSQGGGKNFHHGLPRGLARSREDRLPGGRLAKKRRQHKNTNWRLSLQVVLRLRGQGGGCWLRRLGEGRAGGCTVKQVCGGSRRD